MDSNPSVQVAILSPRSQIRQDILGEGHNYVWNHRKKDQPTTFMFFFMLLIDETCIRIERFDELIKNKPLLIARALRFATYQTFGDSIPLPKIHPFQDLEHPKILEADLIRYIVIACFLKINT